ncbi:MAG: glycosyltransferase family 2 protein [Phycisphaerae bacterium]|nr:glycosyltransferase family 2 protein [Planctomycetota bacterium]MBL7222080.1 glycosyltransferase family 2 protein [Phycisphaerae bacterium]
MNYSNLSICVPAYNEQEAVVKTLKRLKRNFPQAEILFVDDGSTDNTLAEARTVDGVRILAHDRNIGYGAAIKTAIRNSTREIVAWYDADGQHRAQDLQKVVQPVLDGEKDAVIGVRTKTSAITRNRLPGKWTLRFIAEVIVRHKIPDLNSGLRCFKREVIIRYLHLLPDGFSASTTSTILMMKRGYRIGYEDIIAVARKGSSSVRIVSDGLKAIQLMLRLLILFEAFGFFALLSMLQIIPGLIYGIVVAIRQNQGFPVLAATIIISGVLTFFMGLLCDQVVALRKERFESKTQ